MSTFAQEAWQIMQERGIAAPTLYMEAKITEKPPVLLSLFSRAMAEAEPDGKSNRFVVDGKRNGTVQAAARD